MPATPPPAQDSITSSDSAGWPDESVRTTLTILIILHLFAVATAVLSNAGPVSPLRAALRQVPLVTSYLQFLHMDLAYNYHLISRDYLDDVLWLEIEAADDREGDPAGVARLPVADLAPGIRRQRLRNFVREIAELATSPDVDPGQAAMLPAALAEGLLAEAGLPFGTYRLRLMRHGPPELLTAAEFRQPEAPEAIYEANLFFDAGEVGLVPVVSEEQRSRVRQP